MDRNNACTMHVVDVDNCFVAQIHVVYAFNVIYPKAISLRAKKPEVASPSCQDIFGIVILSFLTQL